jgi:predicted PurR-regulated permease PerM
MLMIGVTGLILFLAWVQSFLKKHHWEDNPFAVICVVLCIVVIVACVFFLVLSEGS